MLQYQTVSPTLLKILNKWLHFEELNDFKLVGGTALALLSGHRISVHIDLFSSKPLNEDINRLIFQQTEVQIITNGNFHLSILDEGIKVDITYWNLNFSEPQLFDKITMASTLDIFAMKLDAITSRQTRKDFIDLDLLIQNYGLNAGFNHYNKLYPYSKNSAILIEAFGNIHLADESEMPNMLVECNWEETKLRLENEARIFLRIGNILIWQLSGSCQI